MSAFETVILHWDRSVARIELDLASLQERRREIERNNRSGFQERGDGVDERETEDRFARTVVHLREVRKERTQIEQSILLASGFSSNDSQN